MANLVTSAKVEGVSLALAQILGSTPNTQLYDSYGKISFTPEQTTKLQNMIDSAMVNKGDDDVQIDLIPVVLPILLKKIVPVALGVLIVGYILGRRHGKGRKKAGRK